MRPRYKNIIQYNYYDNERFNEVRKVYFLLIYDNSEKIDAFFHKRNIHELRYLEINYYKSR